MGMKAFTSTSMGVPGKTVGTMFTPVPVEIVCQEAERVGVNFVQHTKERLSRTGGIPIPNDLQQVTTTCIRLQDMLSKLTDYVDAVVRGQVPADSTVGRCLMELVNSVPKISPEDFEEIVNSNMKDLLMVVYLSNLTKTQLILGEKLNMI